MLKWISDTADVVTERNKFDLATGVSRERHAHEWYPQYTPLEMHQTKVMNMCNGLTAIRCTQGDTS